MSNKIVLDMRFVWKENILVVLAMKMNKKCVCEMIDIFYFMIVNICYSYVFQNIMLNSKCLLS
jgi:hypothetical protein